MNATEIATLFLRALDRSEWSEAVALIEPGQLVRFQKEQLAHTIAWLAFQDILSGPGPHPSGFGSDGQLNNHELARRSDSPIPGYRGVATLGELAALSPSEFMVRHLEAGRHFPRYFRNPAGEFIRIPMRVLGETALNPDVVYVVYIHDYPRDPTNQNVLADAPHPAFLPMFRREEKWFVGFNTDLRLAGPSLSLPHTDDDDGADVL